jgi:hypothetical protein
MIPANKAPNANIQAPNKHQAPNLNTTATAILEFGFWMFSGAWSLRFGA